METPNLELTHDLYLEERRRAIYEQVAAHGRASVTELSRTFGVSEVTIRADLKALAERDLVVRTHGGAVPNQGEITELALASRRRQHVREKSRIGEYAAALVSDGDAVFLDSSSTSLSIAYHLKNCRHSTVITNSLAVIHELIDASDTTVVMTGGKLDRATHSLVGNQGLESIRQLNIRIGFFGAHGINTAEGLTDVSAEVAAVKRPLVQMCHQVVAVLDATKWGRVGVASFADVTEIDRIITTDGVPKNLLEQIQAAGPIVSIV